MIDARSFSPLRRRVTPLFDRRDAQLKLNARRRLYTMDKLLSSIEEVKEKLSSDEYMKIMNSLGEVNKHSGSFYRVTYLDGELFEPRSLSKRIFNRMLRYMDENELTIEELVDEETDEYPEELMDDLLGMMILSCRIRPNIKLESFTADEVNSINESLERGGYCYVDHELHNSVIIKLAKFQARP